MREKKFSKSRVLALVLAFAMVVTALPFAGFDAKAADDNNSVTVYRAYNTQTNDHLFTADENEYKTTIQNPIWNDEGRAWSAPKSSSTPIYRAYNTSNGEHLYTADAGEYNSLPGGWNKEGTLLYSDDAMGKPVYRLFCGEWDLHLYTADENEMATLLASGSWTADFGGEAAYYALADQSAEVSLVDTNGLQADGTALNSDTLKTVFGSNFGTPESIAWYHNGTVVKVCTGTLAPTDFQLSGARDYATAGRVLPDGEFYAVVTNTNGQSFTTNSIMVGVATEGVIYDFNLENNMEAMMSHSTTYSDRIKAGSMTAAQGVSEMVEIDDQTDNVVVSVTFNKDYTGNLYLVDAENDTITNDDLGRVISVTGGAVKAGLKDVERQNKVTNTQLWDNTYNTADTLENVALANVGIYCINTDGTVNYKFQNKAFNNKKLQRGHSYLLVFEDPTDPIAVGDDVEGLNATEEVECPYVLAPTDIEISSAAAGTDVAGWDAQISNGLLGMDASWINTVTGIDSTTGTDMPIESGNAKITFYQNTVSKNTGGTSLFFTPGGGTYVKYDAGALTGATVSIGGTSPVAKQQAVATGAGVQAVYAEFTANANIFGPDKVKLVSSAVEFTSAPANGWSVTDEGEDLTVEIDGLKQQASGTVYLFNGNKTNLNTYAKIAGQDESKAIASEWISGSTDEVVFKGVFNQSQLDGAKAKSSSSFTVVFVPDDETRYASVNKNGGTAALNFDITDEETTWEFGGSTTGITTATTMQINAKNQFGTSMDVQTAKTFGSKFEPKSTQANTDAGITLFVAANGSSNISLGAGKEGRDIQKGDKYTVKFNDYYSLVFECSKEDPATPEFKVTEINLWSV